MSEKIGGAKGTELDEEFCEMEKVCLTVSLLDLTHCQELVSSSDVLLYPKPSCWQRASADKIIITKLDIILGENVAFV